MIYVARFRNNVCHSSVLPLSRRVQRSGIDIQWDWLLSDMAVLRARKYAQLRKHLPAEGVARQHSLNRKLQGSLWRLLQQLLKRHRLKVPDVTSVAVIHLVFKLIAGDANLFRVHDHDVVARIYVRGIFGLMLALEPSGDFRRQASQGLVCGIHHVPVALNILRLGRKRLHDL